MTLKRLFVVLTGITALNVSLSEVSAQEAPVRPLDSRPVLQGILQPFQSIERDNWVRDYLAWKKWNQRWFNKISLGKRKKRPQPPVWLESHCSQLLENSSQLIMACDLLKEYLEDYKTRALRQRINIERVRKEAPTKTMFFERIHLDGLWPILDASSYSYGGVAGIHVSLIDIGRVGIFGAPGVMLLSLPDEKGGRKLKIGVDYGISVRLFDFQPPHTKRLYVLHFNFANVWTTPSNSLGVGFQERLSIAGFSVTLKKSR